jgi:hypothetical protein
MSRVQLTALATLSLLATVAVLVAGGSSPGYGSLQGALRAAAAQHAATTVPAGGRAGDADAGGDDGDAGEAADDADDEVGSLDESTADTGDAAAAADDGTATGDGGETGDDTDGATDDGGDDDGATGDDAADEPRPTKVRHVFVVALHGQGYETTFGEGAAASAPYLTGELRPKGVLLSGYRSLASAELPDHVALVGGQPPNADTRADCPVFREIPPTATPSRSGEVRADGCVFPNTVVTLGDQLSATRRSWRAYVEDLDRGEPRRTTCRRPESNGADDTLRGRLGDGYATRRNPFVYFHSLLDLGDCDANDGALERLSDDLRAVKTTPSFSWIAPNLCNAGTEAPCADGSPGGLPAADAFLKTWAPRILASPAYRKGGLLLVLFAGGTGGSEPPAGGAGPRNGALLLSPFAQAGTTAASAYDPYALLRSVEDLFALRPLARAATASSFAPTVLGSAYTEPPSDG